MVGIDPPQPPGEVTFPGSNERMNADRPDSKKTRIPVENTGRRIVQVGSHYHFFETNPVLGFDRTAAYGKRLDMPPGKRQHFPPGETREAVLIPIEGDGIVRSFYGVVNDSIEAYTPEEALDRLQDRIHEPLADPPAEDGSK